MTKVNIKDCETFYLKGLILGFYLTKDELEKLNNLFYKMKNNYDSSKFIQNVSAYTLVDSKIPIIRDIRPFDYGYLQNINENIKSIEMKIIQLTEQNFLALMTFYTTNETQNKYLSQVKDNIFLKISKNNLREFKKYLFKKEIEVVNNSIPINFNLQRKYEKDFSLEVNKFLKKHKINYKDYYNPFFSKINYINCKCIDDSKKFWEEIGLCSNYSINYVINKDKVLICSSLYNLNEMDIFISSNVENNPNFSITNSLYSFEWKSLLYISIQHMLKYVTDKTKEIPLRNSKRKYYNYIDQLSDYQSLIENIKESPILQEKYFSINGKEISLIEDLKKVSENIEKKKRLLGVHFDRRQLKSISTYNLTIMFISILTLIFTVAGVMSTFFKYDIDNVSTRFPQKEYTHAYEALISENYTQSAKQFARLSSKYSVYPEIWYQYGSCCMETGDYDTAIASFNKAAELYENSVMYDDKPGLRNDALVTIGEVHLLRHDFDSAKDQFEKCLSLKNDRDMIIAIAATYIRLGFTAECEAYFAEKGIDLAELR